MNRNLMIQGTMSNAGKSLLTAGILRVLKQDGYRVAPFKSQNMALNSFITKDGLEMGRAQVMQAEAAGIEPQVCMNPILLKPTSDVGSQVIVNGEVVGNYSAKSYFRMKKSLVPAILEAYHKLEEQTDIIIIEGAGSPAEINLRADDIVNMGLAEMVDAPVVLVGDIDRGGVFAQLLGTVMLLEEQEKKRMKGFIINKFRGDATLLEPGPSMLEQKCGIPTIGVMPYLRISLDDEDSLSGRLTFKKEQKPITIAVIRLPHISNFTDFNPIECFDGVNLQYVEKREQLIEPDFLIIPGTKNTMADLEWLRESGIEACILRLAAKGCKIMGICGGYQMLGNVLYDPDDVEHGGTMRGMGLLPMETTFIREKTRTRISGKTWKLTEPFGMIQDMQVSGYEIHMGETVLEKGAQPFCILEDGREDGCVQGNVLGTYLHGILEEGNFAKMLILSLFETKGIRMEEAPQKDYRTFKEEQYDLLADAVRRHLDMETVYRIIGI